MKVYVPSIEGNVDCLCLFLGALMTVSPIEQLEIYEERIEKREAYAALRGDFLESVVMFHLLLLTSIYHSTTEPISSFHQSVS